MKKIKQHIFLLAICTLITFTNSAHADKLVEDAGFLKNNDLQAINAAVKHPNGKTHFFVGKYFHVYNTITGKLEKMGLIGKDGWYGLPVNVDAALIHPVNKKGYIFRGNMYYRYDFARRKVDKIGQVGKDGFKGLIGPFDAAMIHPTNKKAYFFKGSKYYSYDFNTKKMAVKNIGRDGWKGVPVNLDAAVMHTNGKAYLFKADNYHRYNFTRRATDNLNSIIGRDGWRLFHKLDAVVFNNLNTGPYNAVRPEHFIRDRYAYYVSFEGIDGFGLWANRSEVKSLTKKRFGYDWYKGVKSNIDAGFLHPKNKKYYFFKGDTYYRYNASTKKMDKDAKIKDGFGVSRVMAAAGIANSNYVYLFDHVNYYKFDVSKNSVIASGLISSKFRGVPNFVDAAVGDEHGYEIRFYKKDVVYAYNFKSGKVTRWGISPSGLFK